MTAGAEPLVRLLALLAVLAMPAIATAQATSPDAAETAATATSPDSGDTSSDDPWEPFNRVMFDFNEGLDRWVVNERQVFEKREFFPPCLLAPGSRLRIVRSARQRDDGTRKCSSALRNPE